MDCREEHRHHHIDATREYGQVSEMYYHNRIDFGVNATTDIVAPHSAYVVMVNYLYAPGEPKAGGAGGTERAANAPNRKAVLHGFPHFWKR